MTTNGGTSFQTRRLRRGRGLALAAALFLFCDMAGAQRLHRYTVSVDAALTELQVRACFDGAPPEALYAESLDAALALIEVRIEGSGKAVEPAGSIRLKNVPDNGCIAYRADVSRPIKKHDRTGGKIRKVGGDLLTSTGIWLWRPLQLAADEDIEIAFALPEGVSVSAPWLPVSMAPGRAVFRMGRSPQDWPASVAFGRFRERELRVGDARLRVSVLDGSPAPDIEALHGWIADAAQMVANLYGRFPLPQAQVVIAPGARGNAPTPEAYVVRGGGPAMHFFVNQRRPIREFYEDWTAVHELSHLLLPYVDPDDAWLSEGIATYYQNVLRARAGRMSADEGWRRLHAGFERGRQSVHGMTLAQATERMYRGGTFMRVYWQGAAMMLIADVRLRQVSAGKQSMDTALDALNECCGGTDRAWKAAEIFEKLDVLTGTNVFGDLHRQHLAAKAFPDLALAYRALGITVGEEGLEFSSDDRHKKMRDMLMAPAADSGARGE
ncbi:MAG: hypothetical protein ACKVP2_01240 [Burkholderiales bacterium]